MPTWSTAVSFRLAVRRAMTRQPLLQATEAELEKLRGNVSRGRLSGAARIGLRVGEVINRLKVKKHFRIEITDSSFDFARRECHHRMNAPRWRRSRNPRSQGRRTDPVGMPAGGTAMPPGPACAEIGCGVLQRRRSAGSQRESGRFAAGTGIKGRNCESEEAVRRRWRTGAQNLTFQLVLTSRTVDHIDTSAIVPRRTRRKAPAGLLVGE